MPANARRSMTPTAGRAVVTGANSGIGEATAVALARRGWEVILACRRPDAAETARDKVATAAAGPAPSVRHLDLADPDSIAAFAGELTAERRPLDLLVNNAGVMAPPRQETADGHELQLGTNHLGPFALTLRLWPVLTGDPERAARVVTVSSFLAATGRVRFDDLDSVASYDPWAAYGQSKLANLLFTRELARRCGEVGAPVLALAAHPGYARTELVANGPGALAPRSDRAALAVSGILVAQSAAGGARPVVHAATAADLAAGTYVGPLLHFRGRPKVIRMPRPARDDAAAARLWAVSEELTGMTWPG